MSMPENFSTDVPPAPTQDVGTELLVSVQGRLKRLRESSNPIDKLFVPFIRGDAQMFDEAAAVVFPELEDRPTLKEFREFTLVLQHPLNNDPRGDEAPTLATLDWTDRNSTLAWLHERAVEYSAMSQDFQKLTASECRTLVTGVLSATDRLLSRTHDALTRSYLASRRTEMVRDLERLGYTVAADGSMQPITGRQANEAPTVSTTEADQLKNPLLGLLTQAIPADVVHVREPSEDEKQFEQDSYFMQRYVRERDTGQKIHMNLQYSVSNQPAEIAPKEADTQAMPEARAAVAADIPVAQEASPLRVDSKADTQEASRAVLVEPPVDERILAKASAKAASILTEAETERTNLIENARAEAAKIVEAARAEAEQIVASAKAEHAKDITQEGDASSEAAPEILTIEEQKQLLQEAYQEVLDDVKRDTELYRRAAERLGTTLEALVGKEQKE